MGRGSDTRERIIAEARRLFAEKGYDGATVALIAERAEITEGAIYRHFSDKKELFMECVGPVVEEAFSRSLDRVREATDVEELVRAIVDVRLQLLEREVESFDILFTEAPYHPELKDLLYERIRAQVADVGPVLAEVQKVGLLRRQPNLLILGLGMTVAMWAVLKLLSVHGDSKEIFGMPFSDQSLKDEFVEFVLYGIAGEAAGRKA